MSQLRRELDVIWVEACRSFRVICLVFIAVVTAVSVHNVIEYGLDCMESSSHHQLHPLFKISLLYVGAVGMFLLAIYVLWGDMLSARAFLPHTEHKPEPEPVLPLEFDPLPEPDA